MVLRKTKANKAGLCPIAIVQGANDNRVYHRTGLRVLLNQFAEGRVKNHPNAVLFNSKIRAAFVKLEQEILGGKADTGSANFYAYAEEILPKLGFADGTVTRWSVCMEQMQEYAPALTFGQITYTYTNVDANRQLKVHCVRSQNQEEPDHARRPSYLRHAAFGEGLQ